MKKLLIVLTCVLALAVGNDVFASAGQNKDGEGWYIHTVTGSQKYFKSHPGEPSQWVLCEEGQCGNEDPKPEPESCETDCYSDFYIEGYSGQGTGINFLKGQSHTEMREINGEMVEVTVLDSGSMGYALQDSEAGYWAEDCGGDCYGGAIGGSLTIGGSSLWGDNSSNSAWVAGLTGSGSLALLYGNNFKGEVFVKGQGEMSTVAFKEKGDRLAYASSNGSYIYDASAGGSGTGLLGVAGVGITGGGSYVNIGDNNISAVSGQATVSGAGSVNSGLSFPNN
jgi:hypothetical protein